MSTRTLPPPSASVGTAGTGTRPGRTRSGTPDPVRLPVPADAAKPRAATNRAGATKLCAVGTRVFDAALHCGAPSGPEGKPCRSLKGKGAEGWCSQHDGHSLVIVFDPSKHCGALTNPLNGATPCRWRKGWGTDHPGSGKCRKHFGNTVTGEKHAAKERAIRAAEILGLPLGDGDPFELLTSAVQHAQSQLHGSAALVREAIEAEGGAQAQMDLQAALNFQTETIRAAFRGGKAVVDAKVADRAQLVDDATLELLKAFLNELLQRIPGPVRPEIQVWASQRLLELATTAPMVH